MKKLILLAVCALLLIGGCASGPPRPWDLTPDHDGQDYDGVEYD